MIADINSIRKMPLARATGFGLVLLCIQQAIHGFMSPIYIDFFLALFTLLVVRARVSHILILAILFGLLQETILPVPTGFYLARNLMIVPVAFLRNLFVWKRTITWIGLFAYAACCEIFLSAILHFQLPGLKHAWVVHSSTIILFAASFALAGFVFHSQKKTIYKWIYRFKRKTEQFRFAKGMS